MVLYLDVLPLDYAATPAHVTVKFHVWPGGQSVETIP